jgi:hypothetical protein
MRGEGGRRRGEAEGSVYGTDWHHRLSLDHGVAFPCAGHIFRVGPREIKVDLAVFIWTQQSLSGLYLFPEDLTPAEFIPATPNPTGLYGQGTESSVPSVLDVAR